MTDKPNRAPRSKRAIAELVEESPILTVAEVDQGYPGEWVLLLVTHNDSHLERMAGRVLDHGRSRSRINRTIGRVWDIYPKALLFPYLAGPRPSIAEFRRRIIEHDFPEEVLRAGW